MINFSNSNTIKILTNINNISNNIKIYKTIR